MAVELTNPQTNYDIKITEPFGDKEGVKLLVEKQPSKNPAAMEEKGAKPKPGFTEALVEIRKKYADAHIDYFITAQEPAIGSLPDPKTYRAEITAGSPEERSVIQRDLLRFLRSQGGFVSKDKTHADRENDPDPSATRSVR